MKSYLTLNTPLDGTVLRDRKFELTRMEGSEGLCRDFHYNLNLCTRERLTDSEMEQLLGGRVTVRIDRADTSDEGAGRFINGVVFILRELGMSRTPHNPEIWRYEMEVSSWLKQLDSARESRIFQKKDNTALTIVADLLTELEMTDFSNRSRRELPRRDYVTMYDETYADFIVRLLQEEGILWRFEHSGDNHMLVFEDDAATLPQLSLQPASVHEGFKTFGPKQSALSIDGCRSVSYDYDSQPAKTVGKEGKSPFNHFEYPGDFATRKQGEEKISRIRAILSAEKQLYEGSSSIRLLESGRRFKINAPLLSDLDGEMFVLRDLQIEATDRTFLNTFTALPAKFPFFYRLSEKKEKPLIKGHQTAFVIGKKSAAETHTDREGRIMVRFHWDRHSPADTGSAMIRNVMPAAGNRRGFLFIPKIGDEVVVAFEDGDPDKPLIIGRVYSANQNLPVQPDAQLHQSVIQPQDGSGVNRILFDDKPGKETLEFRAKKDMTVKVGGDLNIAVNNDLGMWAKNVNIKTTGNVLTGNVISLSVKGIEETAGKKISNITGLAVANITGAVMNNAAGSHNVNMALGMVDASSGAASAAVSPAILNTSAGDVEFSGKNGHKSSGMVIVNTGTDIIANSAGSKMQQEAKLAIITKSKTETNKLGSAAETKALLVKDKAETTINHE